MPFDPNGHILGTSNGHPSPSAGRAPAVRETGESTHMKRDMHLAPRYPAGRERFPFAFVLTILAALAVASAPGCSSTPPTGAGEHTGSTSQALGEQTCSGGNYCGTPGSSPSATWIETGCGDGHCGVETWYTSGLPSGVTGTFSPTSTTLENVTTLTLAIGSSVTPGTYSFTLGASCSLTTCGTLGLTLIVESVGKSLGPDDSPNTGEVSAGEPIDVGSGNVSYEYTDYTTAGQNPLSFTRYYNSLGNATGVLTVASELGVNWRSTYDRYIQIPPSSPVTVERATGRHLIFALSGSTWRPDADVDIKLTHSGSTWTLTDHDDTVETYTTATGGAYAVLNSIVTRNGYTQTLTYTSGKLTSVSDSYSRTLTLAYNSDGTLHTVATPDSTTITYGYTSVTGGIQLTSATFPTSPTQTITYAYAASGLPFALTSITDENGNGYITWTYDSVGRGLTSQFGSGVNLTTLVYNTDGSRTVTNALGVTDTYTFSTLQGVPKVTGISRASTSTTAAATEAMTYDSGGYLATLTDWNGNQTAWTNNGHGDPTTIVEASGSSVARTTTVAYNSTHVHLPDSITTPGVTTSFTYDSSGDVLTKVLTDTTTTSTPYSTNGQTRTWTNTWSNHLLASVETPNSNTTTFGYSSGALTSITNALSQVTSITSNTGGGRPLTVVDPNSVTTTLTYDQRQRLLTSAVTMSAGTRTTTYTYDKAGELTQTTLPDSSYLVNTFDTAHRITQVTDAIGNYTNYTLDALGDRTATDVYHYYGSLYAQHGGTFNALGRLLVDTGGRSQTTTYTYDTNGNALTVTDGNSHTTTRTFDALNRLSTSTDANSGTTTTTYDAHDRVTNVQDALSHSTSYVFDGFGDVIQQTSPDTGTGNAPRPVELRVAEAAGLSSYATFFSSATVAAVGRMAATREGMLT